MPTLNDFIKRADEMVAIATSTLSKRKTTSYGEGIETEAFQYMRSTGLSFIRMVYGEGHPHFRNFDTRTAHGWDYEVKYAIGILTAVRDELAGGWLVTARGLVSAEVFADFLEMADHLLQEGYKDAAAVMIGSVLEEHLRGLAAKHAVPIEELRDGRMKPRKADSLNADLRKANAYSLLDQKSVTAWLDLRNSAAHANYAAYTRDQVKNMLDGVTNFLTRAPL